MISSGILMCMTTAITVANALGPGCSCPEVATFSKLEWSGTIKSPNYPSYYCSTLSCLWVVKKGVEGTGIRLHFETFETEMGADYLDIFFVGDGEILHKLIRLTGNVDSSGLPNYVVSSDGGFELMFKTDGSSQRRGFLAHFTRFNITSDTCGCPNFFYTAKTEESTLTSPNYPDPYCHNLQCHYLIKARPLHSVHLRFDAFELESRYDSVTVFDGERSEDVYRTKRIANLNGTFGLNKEYTSHSNSLMLVFRSDGDTNHKGFKAIFKEIDGPCRCNNKTMKAVSGNFSSPGFPTGYCGTLNCTYTISVESNKVIRLEFPVFRLLTGDAVYVESAQALPMMKWRGTYSYANFRFTSNSNILKLRMVTTAAGGSTGFNATYNAVERQPGCACPNPNPIIVEKVEGNLSMNACGPLDCFYILNHPGENYNLLTVWVDKVDIHPSKDWLRIYKGRFTILGYPESVRTFSGQVTNHSAIGISAEESQEVMFYFHSEGVQNGQDSGFKLRYRWASQVCTCGQLSLIGKLQPQILRSPGYPVPYCNGLNCKWRIRVPPNHRVVINVSDFQSEPSDTDNLGVYEGVTTTMDTRLQLYKGDMKNDFLPPVTKTVGSVMTLWFTTDRSVVFRGWNLTYYAEAAVGDRSTTAASNESFPFAYSLPEQRIIVNTLPQSSMGWSFATGIFLGILISILVCGLVFLLRRTGHCRYWKNDSSVAYVRYPHNNSNGVNEGYVNSEHAYIVSSGDF